MRRSGRPAVVARTSRQVFGSGTRIAGTFHSRSTAIAFGPRPTTVRPRREDRRKRLSYLAASGIRNRVGQALSPAGDPQQYTSTKSMFKGKPSARRRERWAVIAAIAAGSVAATLLLGNIRLFQLIH